MVYPMVSPMMAPMVADTATHTGLMSSVCREDSSAALTSTISPGSGMPRLSQSDDHADHQVHRERWMVSRIASTFIGQGCRIAVGDRREPRVHPDRTQLSRLRRYSVPTPSRTRLIIRIAVASTLICGGTAAFTAAFTYSG